MQWLIDIVLENLKGMIILWSGAIVDIPDGWHLCDGTNGTPDLRDKWVCGAGSIYDPGDTFGTFSHRHDFTGDGHRHNLLAYHTVAGGTPYDDLTDLVPAVGTTDSKSTVPPTRALCYIMKL